MPPATASSSRTSGKTFRWTSAKGASTSRRRLFTEGRALEPKIARNVRTDIRLFRLGGEAILSAIEAAGYDTLTARPRVSKATKARLALKTGARMALGF